MELRRRGVKKDSDPAAVGVSGLDRGEATRLVCLPVLSWPKIKNIVMAKAIAEQKDKAMTLAARVKPDGLFYARKSTYSTKPKF